MVGEKCPPLASPNPVVVSDTRATGSTSGRGEEMLGFNNEAQGWLPCKIVETAPQEKLWTVDWWDNSQGDRTKGKEGLRPFEEAG